MQGDNTDEVREVVVEESGDLFITEQLCGRHRGGRESEDTSKAIPDWQKNKLLQDQTASPKKTVAAWKQQVWWYSGCEELNERRGNRRVGGRKRRNRAGWLDYNPSPE